VSADVFLPALNLLAMPSGHSHLLLQGVFKVVLLFPSYLYTSTLAWMPLPTLPLTTFIVLS
jgi:hypothetical protein